MTARSPRVVALVLLASVGCGREVAQTAELVPPAMSGLDCATMPGAVELPNGAPFGDGNEAPSPLVGQGYGPSAGPGLFIAARDRFRAYLNGELVYESAAPRTAAFVPLTILPGDNVLSVVVSAQSGPPAVLVQLDELERAYFSDTTFRVTTTPSGDFHDPSYDASPWPIAVDAGPFGSLPGCDPTGVFPAGSLSRWIAAPPGSGSTAVFRTTISVVPEGFAAGTTGGYGATPVLVTSYDELSAALEEPDTGAVILLAEGVHDFRQTGDEIREQPSCPTPCHNDPTRIAYTVLTGDETCPEELVTQTRNERGLRLASNKTLVGLGRGAALRGVSVDIGPGENIIVRNVAVYDVNRALIEAGDAFGLSEPSRVWLDHCTTKWISDGFTDVRPGAQNVTFSYMHYDGANPDACSGRHPRTAHITDSSVTVHHSFFDGVESGSPFTDRPAARVHVYNNFLSDNPGFGVGAGCGAQVLMEGNVFETIESPTLRTGCADDATLGLIRAPPGSNLYRGDVGEHQGGDGLEPQDAVFTAPYTYVVEAPQDAWLKVISRAGAGGPWALPLTLD